MTSYKEIINRTRYSSYSVERSDAGSIFYHTMQAVHALLGPYMSFFNVKHAPDREWVTFESIYKPLERFTVNQLERYTNDCFSKEFIENANAEVLTRPNDSYKNIIESNIRHGNYNPQLRFLIGCPGVGKSSFIRFFKNSVVPNLETNGIPVHCSESFFNVGAQSCIESTNQILGSIEKSLSIPNGGDTSETVRLDKIGNECNKKIVVHFVDNLDLIPDPEVVIHIIKRAMSLHEQLRRRQMDSPAGSTGFSMIIISMRKLTFQKLFRSGILDAEFAAIDLLPPPPSADVFKIRLRHITSLISDDLRKHTKKTIHVSHDTDWQKEARVKSGEMIHRAIISGKENGKEYRLELGLDQASTIMHHILSSLSLEAEEYLHAITHGNVRAQMWLVLALTKTVSLTATKPVKLILRAMLKLSSKIPEGPHVTLPQILMALRELPPGIMGTNDSICEENIFENSPPDFDTVQKEHWWGENNGWWHYLVKVRILQYLHKTKSRDTGISVSKLCLELAKLKYPHEAVVTALRSFSDNRIINSDFANKSLIDPSSKKRIVISPVGEYIYNILIHNHAFAILEITKCPLDFNIKDVEDNNSYLPSIRFLELFKVMETTEEIIAQRIGMTDHLLQIRGHEPFWKRMHNAWFEPLRKIGKSVLNRKSTQKNHSYSMIQAAISRFDNIPKLPDNELGFEVKCDDVPSRCKSCLDKMCYNEGNPQHYENPYTKRFYRVEYINHLRPDKIQETKGAEIFYMQAPTPARICDKKVPPRECLKMTIDGCTAGEIFRLLSRSGLDCGKTIDQIFIHHLKGIASEALNSEGLDFVTMNISSEVLEDTENIDDLLIQFLLENENVHLEFPESPDSPKKYRDSFNKFKKTLSGKKKKIILDDVGGKGSYASQLHSDDEQKRFISAQKLDYIFFQSFFEEEHRNFLEQKIITLSSITEEFNQFLVVEGVEEDDHLEFLKNLASEKNIRNLYIQGHLIQKTTE